MSARLDKNCGINIYLYPYFASTLEDLSDDILLASLGQELRKLHFRVTHGDMKRYMRRYD